MRVLYVSSGLDPRTGGTATAAISVCLAAQRAGIDAVLAYAYEPGTEVAIEPGLAALRAAGVTAHGFPFWQRGGRRAVGWGISPALNHWVAQEAKSFDVIHGHSVWVLSSLRALRSARAAGKPFVLMPHEGLTRFDMSRGGNALLVRLKSLLRRYYVRHSAAIVLSSELERLDSRLEHATVIAHPVFDEQKSYEPPAVPAPEAPITVGFIGRFHKKKNLHLLIDALAMAPGVHLSIGGEGDAEFTRSLIARVERHRMADRVTWHGFIAAEAKHDFYRSVDLIAMPSKFECFGLVGAEAMAEGIPVLVSPTVGIAEDVTAGSCGLVIPPRPDAIGVALARLKHATLTEWGKAARQVALTHYSLGAHGERLRALYTNLLASE